jgi:AbrB family looped-hinge helix DNA binding protein
VDEKGRLVLPPEVAARFGLKPGTRVLLGEAGDKIHLEKPVTHLSKVYVEPTNRCNLECRTCLRNSWIEHLGQMSGATYGRIMDGLRSFSPPPAVCFGGVGEPLSHPEIVQMVGQAKELGSTVELITNGTLLTRDLSEQLIEAGLDALWVSLDGATAESYADVRLGAALPEVLANLIGFREIRLAKRLSLALFDLHLKPQIGIVFVAMKRNIAELPAVLRLGHRFGARRFLVTNVLPYAKEMYGQILYARALEGGIYAPSRWGSSLEVPRVDISPMTHEALHEIMLTGHPMSLAGAIYDHECFTNGYERSLRRYALGSVLERGLPELWSSPDYLSFRERVQKFDFSPCFTCGGCDLFEANEEDCFGSPFPTCGGCLWAQGVIRCP